MFTEIISEMKAQVSRYLCFQLSNNHCVMNLFLRGEDKFLRSREYKLWTSLNHNIM